MKSTWPHGARATPRELQEPPHGKPAALAVALGLIAMAAWPGHGAQAADPCAPGELMRVDVSRGRLTLAWTGRIDRDMPEKIAAEFAKAKNRIEEVALCLNSCGGSVRSMERMIGVLRDIRKTHRLLTMVGRADICGSACVPVFLQGQSRYGALTSSWLFHETARLKLDPSGDDARRQLAPPEETERLYDLYYLPAGVSKEWLSRLRRLIRNHDLYQTGENLVQLESRIITHPLDNLVPREDVETHEKPLVGDFWLSVPAP